MPAPEPTNKMGTKGSSGNLKLDSIALTRSLLLYLRLLGYWRLLRNSEQTPILSFMGVFIVNALTTILMRLGFILELDDMV